MPNLASRTVAGGGYCAEAVALFARFTTAPSGLRKRQINRLILTLKGVGIWAKLDALYVLAAADAQAAQRNWIADQYNPSVSGSLTFTPDRGYTGDGGASYLATGIFPNTLSKFAQNNAHISAYERGGAGGPLVLRAAASPPNLLTSTAGVSVTPRVNGAVATSTAWVAGSDHDYVASRSASGSFLYYHNGVFVGTSTSTSAAPDSAELQLLRASTAQQIFFTIGLDLTAAEVAARYAALSTYARGVGAIA